MQFYSLPNLIRRGLRGHRGWTSAWRKAEPKPSYDVVIVGAGGHGLATAYYLAKVHGVRNVAVLERGWLGGGNVGRNTAIIRSNYLWDASAHLYEFSLKLWEGLSQELNYNVMFSQRGVLNIGHSEQEMRDLARRVGANRLNGIDAELLSTEEISKLVPILNTSPDTRYPVLGGSLQRRGGVARHDAVAWGYARAADALGVDIIESCEVTGIRRANGRATALETTRGEIRAGTIGLVVAGNASVLGSMAGIRLPIQSHPLQALVTEPLKPVLDPVVMSIPSSCPRPSTPTSTRPTAANWSWAQASTRQPATTCAAISASSSTRWPPSWNCSQSSAASACCGSGPASWMSAPTPAPSSPARRSRASI